MESCLILCIFAGKYLRVFKMIKENQIVQDKKTFISLSDSEKLAAIINHDIMKLKVMEIAEITNHYNLDFIEKVLQKVELMSDIDRFIGIIKTRWQIDVYDCRDMVVKYDATKKEYVPYVPDLKQRLDNIRDRIFNKRELEQQLEKEWKEWEVEHQSPSTKTEAPQFISETSELRETDIPKIADLDPNAQGILNITNDDDFAELVDIVRYEIDPWLNKLNPNNPKKRCRRKKDANVVRFAFRYWGIVNPDCSVKNFVLLYNKMVPGAELVDDTVSSREDANMKSKDFYKYDSLPNCNLLKKDAEQLRKMLKPVIEKLVE